MNYINDVITALMILIPISAATRAVYCIMKMISDPEQELSYKTRLKNLVTFVILSECILSLIELTRAYLGF